MPSSIFQLDTEKNKIMIDFHTLLGGFIAWLIYLFVGQFLLNGLLNLFYDLRKYDR